MFQRLAISLTVLCVLWHGLFGCCAHHGHDLRASSVAAAGPHESHCLCKASCDPAQSNPTARSGDDQAAFDDLIGQPVDNQESNCDGERCDFTSAGDRTQVTFSPCAEWQSASPTLHTGILTHEQNFDKSDHRSSIFSVRLRSHLVLRVLLV